MRSVLAIVLIVGSLTAQTAELTPLEKEFQDAMNNVVLEGQFSRDSKPGVSEDKYVIEKAVKQSGGTWLIYARVSMKGQNVTIPLPLEVKWAGDTPVITITDQTLPGMGTYTARVLIYRGHYAGTWSGGKSGGKVFGRVTKQ